MSITERAKDMGVEELVKENRKLKEKIKRLEFDVDAWHQLKLLLEWEIEKLREENKKLKEENEKLRIDREFDKWNTIFGM